MPKDHSDNSWNMDDVVPPAAHARDPSADDPLANYRQNAIPPLPIPELEYPDLKPAPRSILDQNQALADAANKLRRGEISAARYDVIGLIHLGARSGAAFEMLGDIEEAAGDLRAAVDAYKTALEIEPARADIGMKIARVALRITEDARRAPIGTAYAGEPKRGADASVGTRIKAVCGSLMFPGIGQMIKGEFLKGIIIASLSVVIGIAVVAPTVTSIMNSLNQDVSSVVGSGQLATVADTPVSPFTWLGLVILTVAFFYSVIDAGCRANAHSRRIEDAIPVTCDTHGISPVKT